MELQSFLEDAFTRWQPQPPVTTVRTRGSVTLDWKQPVFQFLEGDLIYRVERKDKVPPWTTVYNGDKTSSLIDYLAPSSPHRFRVTIILMASAVPSMAERALQFHGDERTVYNKIREFVNPSLDNNDKESVKDDNINIVTESSEETPTIDETQDPQDDTVLKKSSEETPAVDENVDASVNVKKPMKRRWLESLSSEESWTCTEADGTSAICFCMAVRGGYIKQLQMMLEERPALLEMINSTNGFTPLITAVMKGDLSTVRYLLSMGADIELRSRGGQTALQLALLGAHAPLAAMLLDRGADITARDINGLRAEHYAADSGCAEAVALLAARGADFNVVDNKGWTPLFRAVCQGASLALIEALLAAGAARDVRDHSGLHLSTAARVLAQNQGRRGEAVARAVDASFPRAMAKAHYARLAGKVATLSTLFRR